MRLARRRKVQDSKKYVSIGRSGTPARTAGFGHLSLSGERGVT